MNSKSILPSANDSFGSSPIRILHLTENSQLSPSNNELQQLLEAEGWEVSFYPYTRVLDGGLLTVANPTCLYLDQPSESVELEQIWRNVQARFEHTELPILAANCWSQVTHVPNEFVPAQAEGGHYYLASRLRNHVSRYRKHMEQPGVEARNGAYNRTYLTYEITKQIHDLKRSHDKFALACIRFDQYSSTCRDSGYLVVERLERELVRTIQSMIRPTDSICYLEEGQLMLVLPSTAGDDGMKLLRRMLEQLRTQLGLTPSGTEEGAMTLSARVMEVANPQSTPEECINRVVFPTLVTLTESSSILEQVDEQDREPYLRKLRIAIIDDDRLVREMLSHQLSDFGDGQYDIEVRAFPDGEEFFMDPWHKENGRFVVIIDRIMPKMDGIETLQRIRSSYDRRRYLCVMLTSRDSELDIATAIQKGANDYILKPFSLKELRARLQRLVGGPR